MKGGGLRVEGEDRRLVAPSEQCRRHVAGHHVEPGHVEDGRGLLPAWQGQGQNYQVRGH